MNRVVDLRRLAAVERSSLLSLVANLSGAALRMLLQIFLARKLSAIAFGQFVLGRSWGEVLAKLPNRGYQIGAPRELPRYERSGDHGLRLGYLRAALLDTSILAGLLSAAAIFIYILVMDRPDRSIVVGLLLVMPLAAAMVSRALLQGSHRYEVGSIFTEIVQPVVFGLVVLTLTSVGRLTAATALIAWIGAFAFVAAGQQVFLYRGLPHSVRVAQAQYDRRSWRKTDRPLYVSFIAGIVLEQGDLVIAGALLSRPDLAAYAIAGRLAVLGRMVNAGVQPVTSSHLSAAAATSDWAESQRIVDRSLRLAAPPSFVLAAIAFVFAEPLVGLFGSGYEDAVLLLRIFLIGNVADALTGPSMWLVSMSGLEQIYSRVMVGFAVVLVLATPIGLVLGGAVGGAWSAALVTVGWNVTLVLIARRRLGVRCYVRFDTFRRAT